MPIETFRTGREPEIIEALSEIIKELVVEHTADAT